MIREPLVRRQGSQVSMRVARGQEDKDGPLPKALTLQLASVTGLQHTLTLL